MDNLYRDELLDLVRESAVQRKVRKPDIIVEDFNSLCGDKLLISIKLDGDEITQYGFEGSGCLISQASAYLLKEKVIGMKLSDLKNISDDEILAELGIPKLTPSRMKCALMAVKTLREKI